MFGSAAICATAVLTSRGWALLSLWSLYFGYHVRRWLWPETAPAEPRLRFYRREVKQRLEYGRIGLRSGLPVAFLGLALVLGPRSRDPWQRRASCSTGRRACLLLVVWAVMFRRNRKRLEHPLAELQALQS